MSENEGNLYIPPFIEYYQDLDFGLSVRWNHKGTTQFFDYNEAEYLELTGWRLPTLSETKELIEKCEWNESNRYINDNGIEGRISWHNDIYISGDRGGTLSGRNFWIKSDKSSSDALAFLMKKGDTKPIIVRKNKNEKLHVCLVKDYSINPIKHVGLRQYLSQILNLVSPQEEKSSNGKTYTDADVRKYIYLTKVFEFRGNANPFEYQGTDKSYFIYLNNRQCCISMMVVAQPDPITEHIESESPYLCLGYTALFTFKRSFLIHFNPLNQSKKVIMDTAQKAEALLLIKSKGDNLSQGIDKEEFIYDAESKYTLTEAIKFVEDYEKEGYKVYACLGVQVMFYSYWH